ncbi:peptidoglycan DD-metalloendopeptidase family protein [Pradoshia sp. D12]|uniref:M23 family metallopeptidase n=1 Tax=Bacillaceae TaxID=186817 RepID=UPI00080AF00C|nr:MULTISPECIES: M23 family metallopeptidase [Bacillaceae]OCA84837.1 peptidase M23 [Bacillus sp. FJAT-27986]QFK72696.1 peptidoglycan DD-metalloendopeptidase family protein [Pradoshia sp. D12]TPF71690.1 peptidase M23 [Bacillus sp. D12]
MFYRILILFILAAYISPCIPVQASASQDEQQLLKKRMEMYKRVEDSTQLPWYYIAAFDQYERSIRLARKDLSDPNTLGILIPADKWTGISNPNTKDTNPLTISFFGGMGIDGDQDGKADPFNEYDQLAAINQYLLSYGVDKDNFRIGIWEYYKRDRAVSIIMSNAQLFKKHQTIDLQKKAFPVPLGSHYTYTSTWGVARGWGGRRSHEGTDIFAGYGVPVRSTCYGIIELKGWNKFGGWRIGIRDINNTYHYFAHLNGFAKGIEVGQLVEPGTLLGGVGSSGYGPPGTSGKFPPHLHYGMYKENGRTEWSFNPYPYLKLWERAEKAAKAK